MLCFFAFQTFNFAENGRHLANQEYRVCIRQELKMCSIVYEPCNRNSFKIGPIFNPAGGGIGNYPGVGNVLPVNAINTFAGTDLQICHLALASIC